MQNKVMKLHHSSHMPSINISDLQYMFINLNDDLVTSDVYQINHENNFAPKSSRQCMS